MTKIMKNKHHTPKQTKIPKFRYFLLGDCMFTSVDSYRGSINTRRERGKFHCHLHPSTKKQISTNKT